MKKTNILKKFYGAENTKFIMQSVRSLERALQYHASTMERSIGRRFPTSVKRVVDSIRCLSEEIIEPGKILYKDFGEMVQVLVSKIFEYLDDHPNEKEVNDAVAKYRSEELIYLKRQFDESNIKLRKISNILSETLDHQYLCIAQIKTATERARRIREGIKDES